MGSAGSDRLSDYRPSGEGGSGGTVSGQEGPPSQDRCSRAFSTTLEDVEHSEYFSRTSELLPLDSRLTVEQRKRVVAVNEAGESVGSIPTSRNYLADCLASGFQYAGVVTTSTPGATAILAADFAVVP